MAFTAPVRSLPYPLDRASNLEVVVGDDLEPCGVPNFPEDSDEKITVLFRLSLNDFVALATAIDVGSDIAYGDDGIKVWYLWMVSVMCAQFCEEVAACLTTENPAVVEALASLIATNQTIINAISSSITEAGSAVPGQPITEQQAQQDIAPPNVKDEFGDCDFDALWGAVQYMVQSGDRAITDFFEQTEAATNSVEMAGIVAQNVPAAGGFAASALEFADQIAETLQEGYAGAYTEAYEQQLSCDIFCRAKTTCEITPDMLVEVLEERLGYVEGALDFGILMQRVGTGVFIGEAIADCAFYIYFTALKFGQQFMGVLGFRTLTDMLSLGADLLASDNWATLCDCGYGYVQEFDFTVSDGGWLSSERNPAFNATYVAGVGWRQLASDYPSDADISFEIWRAMSAEGDFAKIEIDYILSDAGSSVNQITMVEFDTVSSITPGTAIFNNLSGVASGTNTYVFTGDFTATAGGLALEILSYVVASGASNVVVTAVRFYGDVNPFA